MKWEPVRRHTFFYQFDFLQSEIARLHELETRWEEAEKRDERERVHESISNMAAVIRADLVNLFNSIDGLDFNDERVSLVLGMLKSHRLRPLKPKRIPKMLKSRPA